MTLQHETEQWVPILEQLRPELPKPPGTDIIRSMALVLSSRHIPHKLSPDSRPTELLVPARLKETAIYEISLYLKENSSQPVRTRQLELKNNILTSLAILALLGIFHNLTYFKIAGFGHNPIDWLELGNADSTKILSGEWWRIVTALTLHADGQHLLGNLLIGAYFVARLCQLTGSGLGWLLILFSGSIGNLANAIFHGPGHNAVGASTAIFGAIGIAGALGTVMSHRRQFRYWILPLAAAAVLLVFLGSGNGSDRTDIGAHLLGFISGVGLGMPAAIYLERKGQAGRFRDRTMAGAAGLLVGIAWTMALL